MLPTGARDGRQRRGVQIAGQISLEERRGRGLAREERKERQLEEMRGKIRGGISPREEAAGDPDATVASIRSRRRSSPLAKLQPGRFVR